MHDIECFLLGLKKCCFRFRDGLSKKYAECNFSLAHEEKTNVTDPGNSGFYIRSLHNLSILIFGYCQSSSFIYYAPAIFNWGAYSITAVRTSVPYVTLLVSVRYLLKGLVYWIEILYTGV